MQKALCGLIRPSSALRSIMRLYGNRVWLPIAAMKWKELNAHPIVLAISQAAVLHPTNWPHLVEDEQFAWPSTATVIGNPTKKDLESSRYASRGVGAIGLDKA